MLGETTIKELPTGMKIVGDLNLNEYIKQLPDVLELGGSLDANSSILESLPEWASHIKGYLDISFIHGISLPDKMIINGNFYCKFSSIEKFPKIMHIGGEAHMEDAYLKNFPDEFSAKVINKYPTGWPKYKYENKP